MIDGLGQWDDCSVWVWLGSPNYSQLTVDDLTLTSAGCLTVGRDDNGLFIILQWSHSHSSSSRVPKSTMKGQASLCSHFPSLCSQHRASHMALHQFPGVKNKFHLLRGGTTMSHCLGV